MPPAKKNHNFVNTHNGDDSRSEISATRERQIAAAAHARKSKAQQHQYAPNGTHHNGPSGLRDLALLSMENGTVVGPEQTGSTGVCSGHFPALTCQT